MGDRHTERKQTQRQYKRGGKADIATDRGIKMSIA